MAETTGIEPATLCVTGIRSNQLSYVSKIGLAKVLPPIYEFAMLNQTNIPPLMHISDLRYCLDLPLARKS